MIKKIIINLFIIVAFSALIFSLNKIPFLPDIFLILTVFNGLFYGSMYGMYFGFFSGLAYDFSTYKLIGFNSLIYAVIGYLIRIPEKKIDTDNIFTGCILVLIFSIIKGILFFILGILFLNSGEVFSYFKETFLIELLLTVVFSFPIFIIYKKINELLGSNKKNE